jgi:hypothetical protein
VLLYLWCERSLARLNDDTYYLEGEKVARKIHLLEVVLMLGGSAYRPPEQEAQLGMLHHRQQTQNGNDVRRWPYRHMLLRADDRHKNSYQWRSQAIEAIQAGGVTAS